MKELTKLQKEAIEIAKGFQALPMQEKIDTIANTFGRDTGHIRTRPCYRKWRGTSDVSIVFEDGVSLYLGNRLTPKSKTKKVQNELLDTALIRYNPVIVSATKAQAYALLKEREKTDNAVALSRGLMPYTLLKVELNDGKNGDDAYLGWYYLVIDVAGVICTHLETGLNYAIVNGDVQGIYTRPQYFAAGALEDAEVDYIINNVGFSSKSALYSLPGSNIK